MQATPTTPIQLAPLTPPLSVSSPLSETPSTSSSFLPTTNAPTTSLSLPANPSSNANPTPTPPPYRPSPKRKPWLNVKLSSFTSYWTKPISAFVIYALTLYISTSASTRYTILGRVSAPLGTWFLTLLAKAGDISFAFAVEDAIDTLTWRKLKERQSRGGSENFTGMRLDWFLALVSSTGVGGLVKMAWRERRRWILGSAAGRWSTVRLAFVLVLIPGPGIVLMANVVQKNVFFPIRDMNVSGGMGMYNPQLAQPSHTVWGPEIARLVQGMSRDRSVTWPMKPASEECRRGKTCNSYLIAGPAWTVAPWPFTNESKEIEGFRLYDAPFYQIDMWDTGPGLNFSASKDCELYGGFNRTTEYSLLLCIAERTKEGRLAAGWKSCQEGYATNGTCLWPGASSENWQTYIQYYRRKATITFSRIDTSILEVTDLSEPIQQNISPSDLFESINQVLYRPLESVNDLRYDKKSTSYVLTQLIGSYLWSSLHERAKSLDIAHMWLENILAMPMYVFQPTIIALGSQLPTESNGTLPFRNLPPENYFKGSYCAVDNRAVPGWRFVLAYAIAAGVLLIFVVVGKLIASLWRSIETSDFPMLDLPALTMLVGDDLGDEVQLRDRLNEKVYREGETLDHIADLRIGLRKFQSV